MKTESVKFSEVKWVMLISLEELLQGYRDALPIMLEEQSEMC